MASPGRSASSRTRRWRGFCLYTVELEERAAGRVRPRPVGRMAVEVFNWWTKRGSLPF